MDRGGADRHAISLSYAICDALRLTPKQVFNVGLPGADHEKDAAPNWHIWNTAKQGRAMAIAPGG